MSLAADFNAATKAQTLPTAQELGHQLLALVQRPRDGATGNSTLHDRAFALIDQGASLTVTDPEYGRSPLMWASIHCRHRLIRAILAREPDILQRDKEDKTALELARQFKNKPAIELLEEAEMKRRAKVVEEATNIATERVTVIRKPLSVKKKPQGMDGQQ